jgi:type II secretion system protein N
MNLKIDRRIVGYTIYGVLILIVLLYLRFPGEVVADYVASTLTGGNPDIMLSIDSIKPTFPPGVKAENIFVSFREDADSNIRLDMLTAGPALLRLLKGKSSFFINMRTYGGTAEGHLDFPGFTSLKEPIDAEISIDNVNVESFAYLRAKLGRQVTGVLKGILTYNSGNNAFTDSTGNIDFTLTNGSYQLLESLVGFDKLDFTKIEGQMTLKNNVLKIDKLKLTGDKVLCSLKGNIVLISNAIKKSQMDMTCDIEIPGQNSKKLSIKLGGTLGKPTTKII